MSKLLYQIENPVGVADNGCDPRSIIHEIEVILGVDSLPFPHDSIYTRKELLNAYYKYQNMVYVVLENKLQSLRQKRTAIMQISESRTETPQLKNLVPHDPNSNTSISWIYILFSFFSGCGLAAFLFHVRKSAQNNIKLSSDIASVISIDGEFHKQIGSREVYSTRLGKGEYLIDFEDIEDKTRHKTFNHEVTTTDSKLVFAEFQGEPSQNDNSAESVPSVAL